MTDQVGQVGELFLLVTDQGFLNQTRVVWETLSNIEGDGEFVDDELNTVAAVPAQEQQEPLTQEQQLEQEEGSFLHPMHSGLYSQISPHNY